MNWNNHVDKWRSCNLCPLHECRQNVVLARGSLPCDVLFIGEAPGKGEDTLGQPFVGPAGIMLDEIIKNNFDESLSLCFTNLVACIPLDEGKDKIPAPKKLHIEACQPRLQEMFSMSKCKAVVCVGKLSKDWVPKMLELGETVRVWIHHPARILRAMEVEKGMLLQYNEVVLRDLSNELMEVKV